MHFHSIAATFRPSPLENRRDCFWKPRWEYYDFSDGDQIEQAYLTGAAGASVVSAVGGRAGTGATYCINFGTMKQVRWKLMAFLHGVALCRNSEPLSRMKYGNIGQVGLSHPRVFPVIHMRRNKKQKMLPNTLL